MRPPDFRDLIDDEGTPAELERLRRAHDLLVGAGPPPELPPRLAQPPGAPGRISFLPRRRKEAAFVLAAAVAAAAFGAGLLIGDRGSSDFPARGQAVAMHATPAGGGARASILVGNPDKVGNWPLLVRVAGLKPLEKGRWYELYLTRKGKRPLWCGAFAVNASGRTTVHFSVPYKLKGAGWIVTDSGNPPKRQVRLTT